MRRLEFDAPQIDDPMMDDDVQKAIIATRRELARNAIYGPGYNPNYYNQVEAQRPQIAVKRVKKG